MKDIVVEETLTQAYERLRHSEDIQELHNFAVQTLPDRSDLAAFSRATALLEAVAGNHHTPLEDRVMLATTIPFPNVLVKLSLDPEREVRMAVANNANAKNWLVGRLTKDPDMSVAATALRNPQVSWKMRLEGAENPHVDAETLAYLAQLGRDAEPAAPVVLAGMVRRAVALNPNTSESTIAYLAQDSSPDVVHACESRNR